ncbi:hypothetical protein SFR_4586 [Streptomyces sp. FR-008]|nr:hypothetical protein SFR_4586 [Streptomyces sp. FR-008]
MGRLLAEGPLRVRLHGGLKRRPGCSVGGVYSRRHVVVTVTVTVIATVIATATATATVIAIAVTVTVIVLGCCRGSWCWGRVSAWVFLRSFVRVRGGGVVAGRDAWCAGWVRGVLAGAVRGGAGGGHRA